MISFHILHCDLAIRLHQSWNTPPSTRSCTRSRGSAWAPAPPRRCTPAWSRGHTSCLLHWNIPPRPRTWSRRRTCSHRPPRLCHCKLDEECSHHYRPESENRETLKDSNIFTPTCLETGLHFWLLTTEHCCSLISLVRMLGTRVQIRRVLGLQSWVGTS